MELKELTLAKAEESLDNAETILEEFAGNNTVRASCSPVTEENAGKNTVQASCSPVTEDNRELNTVRASCSPVKNSPVEEKKKIADNCQEIYNLVMQAKNLIGGEKPFNHPYYWAGFVCQGEG